MSQAELPLRSSLDGIVTSRPLRPVGRVFFVVYLTFASLLLIDPQPVLDWLDDLDPSTLVSAARASMGAVAAASDALGLSTLSRSVRSRTAPLFKRSETRPS